VALFPPTRFILPVRIMVRVTMRWCWRECSVENASPICYNSPSRCSVV